VVEAVEVVMDEEVKQVAENMLLGVKVPKKSPTPV
jgi:hypothetical protein